MLLGYMFKENFVKIKLYFFVLISPVTDASDFISASFGFGFVFSRKVWVPAQILLQIHKDPLKKY